MGKIQTRHVSKTCRVFVYYGNHPSTSLRTGLGSTSLVTDESGNEVSRTEYTPYGSLLNQTGTLPTDRLYTGQRIEPTTGGLYDYRARFYDPLVGSFISADTIVPEPGSSGGFNRYRYTRNNPLKYVDPTGHCAGLSGTVWSVCAYTVLAVAPAVHKANEYRDDIFFPDENTTTWDRVEASTMVGGVPVAVAGAPTLIIKGVAYFTVAGSATCADGDCGNEIRHLTKADLSAIKRFVQEAKQINLIERDYGTFGEQWNQFGRSMLGGAESRMFIARTGERITGMMKVNYSGKSYRIQMLEGLGGGSGTALFKQAIRDSVARDYGGSIRLFPAEKALRWYLESFPGAQRLADKDLYWSAEAAKAILDH